MKTDYFVTSNIFAIIYIIETRYLMINVYVLPFICQKLCPGTRLVNNVINVGYRLRVQYVFISRTFEETKRYFLKIKAYLFQEKLARIFISNETINKLNLSFFLSRRNSILGNISYLF